MAEENPEDTLPDEIKRALKTICDNCRDEDSSVRDRQILRLRKLKLYWIGLQRVWYDYVAHDWKIYDEISEEDDNDAAYYDKPINIFRANLESIIAALSITIPSIACVPDNADNPQDISTAKAGEKIAKLIYKHNNVDLLWLYALFTICTEDLLACYSYSKEDKKYGTYDKKHYEPGEVDGRLCPVCGVELADQLFSNMAMDEFNPDDEDAPLHEEIEENGPVCPTCGTMLDPNMQKSPIKIKRLVGTTKEPKTRQCLDVYGGLYVKVPFYSKKQEDFPYLRLSYETPYTSAIDRYPFLRDKLKGRSGGLDNVAGVDDYYGSWARMAPMYIGDFPTNTVTHNCTWIRPCHFNIVEEEMVKKLKKRYPDGCKVIQINDEFAEACNENMDDCWTVAKSPLSDYIHFDPLGSSLISPQDIVNDLVALTLQTIEQGITETFIDPSILDAAAYKQEEKTPGNVYFTKAVDAQKNISDGFFQLKAANLSSEVMPFGEKIGQMAQFTSGAFPALSGAPAQAGSKTASEYAMSRNQAQQRQSINWKMLRVWWKEIFAKVIPAYMKDMVEDERYVERIDKENYLNVYIRKMETLGTIGDIELEPSDNMPVSMEQKKDVLMQLMPIAQTSQWLAEAFTSPENIPFLREALGLSELVIPGEAYRQKQYEEIQQLLMSEPMIVPGPMGEMELPSVEVDPILDNHEIEGMVCKNWLVSEAGRLAKIENPNGYLNVLAHARQHMQFAMEQMMAQQAAMMGPNPDAGGNDPSQQKKKRQSAQIKEGGQNVEQRLPIH